MNTRLLFLLLSFLFLYVSSPAQEFIRVDSTIADEYKIWEFQEESAPWEIHVIEIDLTKEGVLPRVALANDLISHNTFSETFTQTETLSSIIDRKMTGGKEIIGGINADFFDMSTGMVFNVTAMEGQIATYGITSTPHAGFYIDDEGAPHIGLIEINQTMTLADSSESAISGVNKNRLEDELILFNKFSGDDQSSANQWGHELLLEPVEEVPFINGSYKYVILDQDGKVTREDDTQIIVTGHGISSDFLQDNASVGDTITITTSFEGVSDSIHIVEMVGGWGHIVSEGNNRAEESIEEEGSMSHEEERHPRSAVGYNKDKTKLFLVAVDGRSESSAGMNLSELADFMIQELGVEEGLNFDGGGSATLMSGDQLINHLSDEAQRAIPTALIVEGNIMTALLNFPVAEERVHVFPNPTSDYVTLEWDRDSKIGQYRNMNFQLLSLDGKMIWEEKFNGMNQKDRLRIDLPQTAPGQYFYTLRSGQTYIASGKLVVQ